jgi:hypothetical protein
MKTISLASFALGEFQYALVEHGRRVVWFKAKFSTEEGQSSDLLVGDRSQCWDYAPFGDCGIGVLTDWMNVIVENARANVE